MILAKSQRSNLRTHRILLLLSTIVAAGTVRPAYAQLAAPAPVRPSVDANGVDLYSGAFNTRGAPISLGRSGNGLTYQQINTGSGWTDSTTVSLNLNGNVMTVAIGGSSDTFTVSGTTYISTEGNGATLTASGTIYTYTQSDGSVIHFDNTKAGIYPYYSNYGRVIDITNPSGLKETFSYSSISYCSRSKPGGNGDICTVHNNAYRVNSVSSTAGYSLSFNYGELDPYDPDDPSNQPNFQQFSTVLGVSSSNASTGAAGPSESFSTSTDGNGYQILSITDAMARTTSYRSSGNYVVAVRLPGSSSDDLSIGYTGVRVSSLATPAGTTTYGSSDNTGTGERTVTVTDPGSHATNYVFDIASQRVKRFTDALGNVTTSQYDGNGRLTQLAKPQGDGLYYTYDGNGNVTAVTAHGKDGSSQAISSASYPCSSSATCNKPIWTRDALNNQTDYAYDATTGETTSVTLPAAANGVRPQTRYAYTSVVGVTLPTAISQCQTSANCSGGADEVKTTIAYNSNLLPTSVSNGAGDGSLTATSAYTYDATGNIISVDGPLPGAADTTTYAYDGDHEMTQATGADPDGGGPLNRRSVIVSYLPTGQISSRSVGTLDGNGTFTALRNVTSSFDAGHRKTSDTVSAGGTTYAVTQYGYDANSRVQCIVQRMNPSSWSSQGDACQLAASGSFGNDRISYTHYDADGRSDYATSAYQTSDAVTERTSYTPNGKTANVTDANGNVTAYSYDVFDRAITTTYPGGSYEQRTLDSNGNVTARRLRDGQTLYYTYDALNRRTYDDNPNTNVAEVDVSYSYDNLGRVLQAQDQNGWYKAYEYDALGRVTREHSNVADNYLQYDLAGRRTRQTWGDGFFITNDYDTIGEMTAIYENGGNFLVSFGYDDLGRRTYMSRANGASTGYNYNAASQLTSLVQTGAPSVTFGFAYNPAGQITSRTSSNDAYAWTGAVNVSRGYSANGLNQYTQAGGTTFGYDARGNLTSSGSTTYGYNTRNELFQGPQGQLIYRNPAGELGQVPNLNFDWVSGQLATESGSAIQRRYVYGPGADEVLVWYEGSGTSDRRFLHADERGSVIAVTDNNGNVSAINTYDEYGIPGASNQGRFQYTGQAWLTEVGLYDFKARMYSPTLGRFMQTDPIGYGDGLNSFNYAHADPINGRDPFGTFGLLGGCPAGEHCTSTNPDSSNRAAAVAMLELDGAPDLIADKAVALVQKFGVTTALSIALQDEQAADRPQNDPNDIVVTAIVSHQRYIQLTTLSYAHIFSQHVWFPFPNTSRFLDKYRNINSIYSLVGTTIMDTTGMQQANGNFRYDGTLPFNVGVDQDGFLTSQLTVIVRPTGPGTGDVVTAYPGR